MGEDCTGVSVSNPHRLRAPLSQIRHTKLCREQNLDNVGYLIVWFRRILSKCYCPCVLIENNASFDSVVVCPIDNIGPSKSPSILIEFIHGAFRWGGLIALVNVDEISKEWFDASFLDFIS